MKRVLLSVGLLVVSVFCLFFVFEVPRIVYGQHAIFAVETYMKSMASSGGCSGLAVSTGNAAYLAQRQITLKTYAAVEDLHSSVSGVGNGWARVLVTLELTLKDGSPDVGWYTVDLIRSGRDWQVVSVKERAPEIPGGSLFRRTESISQTEKVFKRYLDEVVNKNWKSAGKSLVGPARRNHELSTPVFAKGTPIKSYQGLHFQPLYHKGRVAVIGASYLADGRRVELMLYEYKTKQGWRIMDIIPA